MMMTVMMMMLVMKMITMMNTNRTTQESQFISYKRSDFFLVLFEQHFAVKAQKEHGLIS